MSIKQIKKNLDEFNKDPPEGWAGGPISEDDLFHWSLLLIVPQNSPYEGGFFNLSIHFKDYPFKAPKFRFETKIYHPNIKDGIIGSCHALTELKNDWSPSLSISVILKKIRDLLITPYLESNCGNDEACYLYKNDINEFNKIAREWTRKYAI